jgi:16S rRNA processing protein RimM
MIRVGQIVGVFGVQGAVKVRSLTDFDDRFDSGSELHVDGVARTVEWSRPGVSNLVVKLRGLDTRNDAEALRGRLLEVPEWDQRQLPDGAWYLDDLLGLAVVTESGRQLGTITEILERPANDVWLVRGDLGETLVPAVRDAVQQVDLPARRVTVGDWLLEVEEG